MSHAPAPSGFPRTSATGRATDAMALYGYVPHGDELDQRPLPETEDLDEVVASVFASVTGPFRDTALETETADLLWSLADVFHRKADRIQRQLDDNESRQRSAHEEQDGSEIRSVDLERLIDKGRILLDKRAAFERMRDKAAECYEHHVGNAWRPRSGSMVNHKTMTASMIDSRDFISAKRRSETEILIPAGAKIAFAGGTEYSDHTLIWATLDKVLAKHPGMVLMHGGSPRGAERIAACWADNRKVVHVAFKPEWARDGKSAPFKRNDRMLEVMPIGLVVFPGSGITENLADKARKFGIPLMDHRKAGA